MTDLKQKLLKALAFDVLRFYQRNSEDNRRLLPVDGAMDENARLNPMHEALVECVEALETSPCTGNGAIHLMSCNKCAALAKLQRLVDA